MLGERMDEAWYSLKHAVHPAAKSGRMPFGEAFIRVVHYVRGDDPTRHPCALATLSRDPPAFYSLGPILGIAPAFGARYGATPAGFMIGFSSSKETTKFADRIAAVARAHLRAYPRHALFYTCNTQREANLLQERGLTASLVNHNLAISETVFRPLPDSVVEFDAVHNAQLAPFKRHHLAEAVDRVALVTYYRKGDRELGSKRKMLADILARNPTHRIVNPIEDGLPVFISAEETNSALNRAAVGLCLSASEGANYASMEYMLAGLPVVSTPSVGGRDVYFDPDYVLICEPDPPAVRDAVMALKARNIPRDYIRAKTLAKIEPDRRRFLDTADDLIERLGGQRRYGGPWPFSGLSPLPVWSLIRDHMLDIERGETRPAGA
jgi:glycosyltransferase involved in cell wall biosynthesis